MSTIQRYVPLGASSLSSDAPGWNSHQQVEQLQQVQQQLQQVPSSSSNLGPVCWKCKGIGKVNDKKALRDQKKRKQKQKKGKEKGKKNPPLDADCDDNVNANVDVDSPIHKKQKIDKDKQNNENNCSNEDSNTAIKKEKEIITQKECPVCKGVGTLPPKQKELKSLHLQSTGMITKKRRCPNGWEPFGPLAFGLQQMEDFISQGKGKEEEWETLVKDHPLMALKKANTNTTTIPIDDSSVGDNTEGVFVSKIITSCDDDNVGREKEITSSYPWLPINPGEQLCNLVGTWRILQRVGSHRWTTDDIVTAYIAKTEIMNSKTNTNSSSSSPIIQPKQKQTLHYLDLGCGNASVLQMVSWSLIESFDLIAFGIEARSEAVSFAKRSLAFNIGKENIGKKISLINGDFRTLEKVSLSSPPSPSTPANTNDDDVDVTCVGRTRGIHDSGMALFEQVKNQKFDLITGTPPYFRVDFSTEEETSKKTKSENKNESQSSSHHPSERIVKSAVINQGGMPTSLQSAPARCEFRGGIENYCSAASSVLANNGTFVVCENWLNNDRVYKGAKDAGLHIIKVLPIKGTTRKKENLFAVYVMKFNSACVDTSGGVNMYNGNRNDGAGNNKEVSCNVLDPISVRGGDGKWTAEYAQIMASMSIPCYNSSE